MWLLAMLCGACSNDGDEGAQEPNQGDDPMQRLAALALPSEPTIPADVTNRYADDPAAAILGQKLFFDPRFSGPLLDDANTGLTGTMGEQYEAERVSCASCHVADGGLFVDTRTSRGQLSLGAGWTHRRTPTLLDVAQARLLGWSGRRATSYAVAFAVIESPVEFNSSRLFAAQQLSKYYREDYEAVFGPMPALDQYDEILPEDAGCERLPVDASNASCPKPGQDDPEVTQIVVNMGKALGAYTRKLTCGPSRFDAWIGGDEAALTPEEQAGALLFVGAGKCDSCHSGPYFSDQQFHNVGAPGELIPFTGVDNSNDPGAMVDLPAAREDPLNSRGEFSDGDDGRLDEIPEDVLALEGAFRTPGLRCLDRRPSYLHSGSTRTLLDVVNLFDQGGAESGFVGTPEVAPLGLALEEREQLVAFLRALQGPGPDAELLGPPAEP